MAWPDCLVDRALTDQELASALGAFLSVQRSTILVVDDLASAALSPHINVICERSYTGGDFIMLLAFYPQNDKIEAGDGAEFIEFLCKTCKCRCLMSDDSLNPYSWILLDGTNRRRGVFLDVDRMDGEPEAYVIAREWSAS